jgi:hypothetical protein
VRPKKPLFQRVRVPSARIAQSAPQLYLTSGGGDSPGESSGVKVSAAGSDPRSVRPGGERSTRPYAKANRLSLENFPHPGLREQEASADGGAGSAEPLRIGRRLLPTGKDWVCAPAGLPGVEEDGTVERNSGERGKGSTPAKTVPYGKDPSYNRNPGSRGEAPSLAAEGIRAMTPVDNITPGEQRPSGWRRLEQRWWSLRAWPVGLFPPTGDRGTRVCGERIRADARAKAVVNHWMVERESAGTVLAAIRTVGMPPLIGLHLSPYGRKGHVRWDGGGQETGESAMDPGDGRLRRKRQG